jgi:hypothetical protein
MLTGGEGGGWHGGATAGFLTKNCQKVSQNVISVQKDSEDVSAGIGIY